MAGLELLALRVRYAAESQLPGVGDTGESRVYNEPDTVEDSVTKTFKACLRFYRNSPS